MASRELLQRIARHGPNHRAMAEGVKNSKGDRTAHWLFHDWLLDHNLRSWTPMITVGENWYVETVTKYWTGVVLALDADWIKLGKAAWIPDTGRYSTFANRGQSTEVEPTAGFQNAEGSFMLIPFHCVTAAGPWPHPLPSEVR